MSRRKRIALGLCGLLLLPLGCSSSKGQFKSSENFGKNPRISLGYKIGPDDYLAPFLFYQHTGQQRNFFTFQKWRDSNEDEQIDESLDELLKIGWGINRKNKDTCINIFFYPGYSENVLGKPAPMPMSEVGKQVNVRIRVLDPDGREVYLEERVSKKGSYEIFSFGLDRATLLGIYRAEAFTDNPQSKETIKFQLIEFGE